MLGWQKSNSPGRRWHCGRKERRKGKRREEEKNRLQQSRGSCSFVPWIRTLETKPYSEKSRSVSGTNYNDYYLTKTIFKANGKFRPQKYSTWVVCFTRNCFVHRLIHFCALWYLDCWSIKKSCMKRLVLMSNQRWLGWWLFSSSSFLRIMWQVYETTIFQNITIWAWSMVGILLKQLADEYCNLIATITFILRYCLFVWLGWVEDLNFKLMLSRHPWSEHCT